MDSEPSPAGLLSQAKVMFATGLSALQNRGELFLLECEEQKAQLVELVVWALMGGLLGLMFLAMITVLVVMLFPEDKRIYAVAGFCALYLAGMALALLNLRALVRNSPPPFSATIGEMKKDRECLDSSK